MGQGQAEKAMSLLKQCVKSGEWLCLKNVHLVVAWLPEFEKELNNLLPSANLGIRRVFELSLLVVPNDLVNLPDILRQPRPVEPKVIGPVLQRDESNNRRDKPGGLGIRGPKTRNRPVPQVNRLLRPGPVGEQLKETDRDR